MKKTFSLFLACALMISTFAGLSMQTFAAEQTTGYCAVGGITADKAAVLFDDGTVKMVSFIGTAPKSGEVQSFIKDANGKYTFTGLSMFPSYGNEYAGWGFGVYAQSQNMWYGDTYAMTAESSFFVRYSATQWRVFKGIDMIKSDNGSSKGYIYTDNVNKTLLVGMIVGACGLENALSPATADNTKFLDVNGLGWDSGDKTLEVGGYCAVGEVSSGKAAILFDNGITETVSYTGTAPASGKIYYFIMDTNGAYSFSQIEMFPPFGTEYTGWGFGVYGESKNMWYGDTYAMTNDSIFFVRYSDTQWRVFRGIDMIKAYSSSSKGYICVDGVNKTLVVGMVTGDCGAENNLAPANATVTSFLDSNAVGWDTGDKNLKITLDSGYCAVGTVNAQTQKAVVLLDTGVVSTISYTGTAPVSGEVYEYAEYLNEEFALIQAALLPGYSNTTASWMFNSYIDPVQKLYFGANYPLTVESVVFARYSATEWRVFKGNDIIKQPMNVSNGYIQVKDGNTALCVIGDCNPATGALIPTNAGNTMFLDPAGNGWNNGDKILRGEISLSGFNQLVGNTLSNINPGTTVTSVKTTMNPYGTVDFLFKDAFAATLNDNSTDKIGTGSTIDVNMNGSNTQYTTLIYGEVTGDGVIGVADLAVVKSHILKITTLTGAFFKAANVHSTGSVTLSDLLSVKKAVLGIGTIDQNPAS